jgi:menaquinone-dependent protoporphyrinogen IX oxidase
MKGMIVYASNYGATEQYARWLGEALGFKAVPVGRAFGLEDCDAVILETNVRVRKLSIAPWARKHWPELRGKRLALFTTSGAPREDPALREWFEACFDEEMRGALPYFPLGGRKKMDEMTWLDRAGVKLGSRMVAKKNPAEAARMLEDLDRMDRAQIEPIAALFRG